LQFIRYFLAKNTANTYGRYLRSHDTTLESKWLRYLK